MSETITDTAPSEVPQVEPTAAPAGAGAHPWDVTQAAPEPDAAPPPEADPAPAVPADPVEPPQKRPPGDRRFAALTAKLSAESERAEKLERELEATRKLIGAGKPETPAVTSGETVEQAAARLIAQRDFEARQAALVATGAKEVGDEAWNEATGFLASLGATRNQAFMQALVELPASAAAKLVTQLAEDADVITGLLRRNPVAMAAEMGRMAAEISRPAPRPVSNAPRPPVRVTPTVVVPTATIYDESLSMAEWNKALESSEFGKKFLRRRA
jgi:hypothetical protein